MRQRFSSFVILSVASETFSATTSSVSFLCGESWVSTVISTFAKPQTTSFWKFLWELQDPIFETENWKPVRDIAAGVLHDSRNAA